MRARALLHMGNDARVSNRAVVCKPQSLQNESKQARARGQQRLLPFCIPSHCGQWRQSSPGPAATARWAQRRDRRSIHRIRTCGRIGNARVGAVCGDEVKWHSSRPAARAVVVHAQACAYGTQPACCPLHARLLQGLRRKQTPNKASRAPVQQHGRGAVPLEQGLAVHQADRHLRAVWRGGPDALRFVVILVEAALGVVHLGGRGGVGWITSRAAAQLDLTSVCC